MLEMGSARFLSLFPFCSSPFQVSLLLISASRFLKDHEHNSPLIRFR